MTLKEIREAKGLTLSEASKKLKITYDYLCMLENSRRSPSMKLIKRMASVYSQKPEVIFLSISRTLRSKHLD